MKECALVPDDRDWGLIITESNAYFAARLNKKFASVFPREPTTAGPIRV